MKVKYLKIGLTGLSTLSFQQYRFNVQAEESSQKCQDDLSSTTKDIKIKAAPTEAVARRLNLQENAGGGNELYRASSSLERDEGKTEGSRRRTLVGDCIIVVGTTGTGKSSTIAKYTGEKILVSDKPNSATRSVMAVKDPRGSEFPVWVDTIGYDDSFYLTDSDSYKELLRFLQQERLLKVKAIVWTVGSQERKDARLRLQADFINQFKDGDIWDNVIIVVKQPGSYNLKQASQGAHEAAKYYAGETSKLQILGFTYLDEKIPLETREKLLQLGLEERTERLLVTDAEMKHQIDRALDNLAGPVQVIFEDTQCTACGVIGDKRLLPDHCHLEQSFTHRGQLRHFHPQTLESYHLLPLESYHPGVLKLTGGASKTCELVRNGIGVLAPLVAIFDITSGIVTAAAAVTATFACSKLESPLSEVYSCCRAERSMAGCQVYYSCCKRKDENRGCCYRFPCCYGGPQAQGCLRRFDCCEREETSIGCFSICRLCGREWGSAGGCTFKANHQLIPSGLNIS